MYVTMQPLIILAITAIVVYTHGLWTGLAVGGILTVLFMAYVTSRIARIGESGRKQAMDDDDDK